MALIDRFLARAVKRGRLTVIHPDGRRATLGAADPDIRDVTIRFADHAAERRILADPGLGAGEMYMAGRLAVEQGDVEEVRVVWHARHGDRGGTR